MTAPGALSRFRERIRRVDCGDPADERVCFHAFFLALDIEAGAEPEVAHALGLDPVRVGRTRRAADALARGSGGEGLLLRRLRERARAWRDGRAALPPTEVERSDLRWISALVLERIDEHFRPADRPLDTHRLARAFEAFAAGELLWTWDVDGVTYRLGGEPDSAFFFYWAELATLAIELDVDSARWEALLMPLVAAQEVYVVVYRPRPKRDANGMTIPVRFQDFEPRNAEGRSLTSELRAAIRARHAALDRAALLAAIGRRAAEDLGLE